MVSIIGGGSAERSEIDPGLAEAHAVRTTLTVRIAKLNGVILSASWLS